MTVLKHIVGWSVVILFTSLLTFIFSFVGAFLCAAVGGMMMGTARVTRWISVPLSLSTPAVLVTIMRLGRSDLTGRQLLMLAVLCLVVFWGLHLVAGALMAFEAKPRPTTVATASDPAKAGSQPAQELAPPAVTAPAVIPLIHLEDLEGSWGCESCGCDGQKHRRYMEIRDGALVLRTLDQEGHTCYCARCGLELVSLSGAQTLVLSPAR